MYQLSCEFFQGLNIKVDGPTIVRAFTEVQFNVTIDRLGLTYEMTYDWGNGDRSQNLIQEMRPIYGFAAPGDFIITVTASDNQAIVPVGAPFNMGEDSGDGGPGLVGLG